MVGFFPKFEKDSKLADIETAVRDFVTSWYKNFLRRLL
jgi:hypothetical protein